MKERLQAKNNLSFRERMLILSFLVGLGRHLDWGPNCCVCCWRGARGAENVYQTPRHACWRQLTGCCPPLKGCYCECCYCWDCCRSDEVESCRHPDPICERCWQEESASTPNNENKASFGVLIKTCRLPWATAGRTVVANPTLGATG